MKEKMKYHKTINSMYVLVVKVKYQNDQYVKCHIRYFTKTSNMLIAEEKNVKIMKDQIKHWEIWNG